MAATKMYDKEGNVISRQQFRELKDKDDYSTVATAEFNSATINTVWTGYPQAGSTAEKPIIFVTNIVSKPKGQMMTVQGYATLKEAKDGHRRIIDNARKTLAGKK